MDSRHTCNLTHLYVYVTSFANFNLELAIVDFIFLSYFLVHLVRVNLGFMNSTFLKLAEDTRFQFAQSDLALNPSAPLVVLFLALRCRARAGFSRRSRENPVWFRPCIAGQTISSYVPTNFQLKRFTVERNP